MKRVGDKMRAMFYICCLMFSWRGYSHRQTLKDGSTNLFEILLVCVGCRVTYTLARLVNRKK